MEQLNYTKVRLAVYDHDPGDEDDFLGVVFIDLATAGDFFNSVITKWYPLLPQVKHKRRFTMLKRKEIKPTITALVYIPIWMFCLLYLISWASILAFSVTLFGQKLCCLR